MQEITQYLNHLQIRPSHARVKIYEYLVKSKEHPRAIDIYESLVRKMPTLSKMTVYNTLNLFVDKGLVNQITIDGSESRFDADVESHCHLQCQSCGRVVDVDINHEQIKSLINSDGFHVTDHQIYLKGYCKVCAMKIKK